MPSFDIIREPKNGRNNANQRPTKGMCRKSVNQSNGQHGLNCLGERGSVTHLHSYHQRMRNSGQQCP
jgi:hypothetical protein